MVVKVLVFWLCLLVLHNPPGAVVEYFGSIAETRDVSQFWLVVQIWVALVLLQGTSIGTLVLFRSANRRVGDLSKEAVGKAQVLMSEVPEVESYIAVVRAQGRKLINAELMAFERLQDVIARQKAEAKLAASEAAVYGGLPGADQSS